MALRERLRGSRRSPTAGSDGGSRGDARLKAEGKRHLINYEHKYLKIKSERRGDAGVPSLRGPHRPPRLQQLDEVWKGPYWGLEVSGLEGRRAKCCTSSAEMVCDASVIACVQLCAPLPRATAWCLLSCSGQKKCDRYTCIIPVHFRART